MTGDKSSNTQQIEYWNGPTGIKWAALQERIDRFLGTITEALMPFADPQTGERALDVGCGCGTTTLLLALKLAPEGRATGVDISVPMLNVARARAQAQNADVTFLEADASTHAFQPVFDLVFSRFGVMFFVDPAHAFANIRHALAPRGRLAFVCWRSLKDNAWASIPMAAAKDLLPPQEPADPLAPGPFAFADGNRIRTILLDAGYRDIEIDKFDGRVNLGETLADAAAQSLAVGPLSRATADLDEAARSKIGDAVAKALALYQSPIGITPGAACWFVSARG
jgi:SAM-dependent methyltransferase